MRGVNMAYIKDTDYQALIDDAVSKGDYRSASEYEKQRNEKIDAENLPYEKTNNYAGRTQGVDDKTYASMQKTFSASSDVTNADKRTENAYSNLERYVNDEEIISDSVMSALNKKFVVPTAVLKADKYLESQLQKIQSGKTSYSDQVKDMMDKIMNREKFSYDVDTDPLFQQALASAMNSGKQAMQDTIGQASALTGGYGSTYATTAGNQAYNAFIEDAYDNLPQYYQMAMDAYQMEGDEMYRQYSMLSAEDDKEFNRNVTAYDATYQHRNQMYNEAYTMYRDNKSDAFAMANLQLDEHEVRVNDAYNLYNASSDYADKLYEREYTKWADEVNLAYKYAEMLNKDWWSQTEFDESVRQYEQSFAEDQRQFNEKLEQDDKHFYDNIEWQTGENQKDRDLTTSENQKDRAHQSSENAADRAHDASESQKDRDFTASENQKDRDFTASQNALNRSSKSSGGSGGSSKSGSGSLKSPTESQMKKALEAYESGGMDGLNKYLNSVPDNYDREAIAQYAGMYGELPYSDRTYTVVNDGGINWWGIDNNAKVTDEYGNEFTLKELAKYDEDIAKELSKKKYTTGTSYSKK